MLIRAMDRQSEKDIQKPKKLQEEEVEQMEQEQSQKLLWIEKYEPKTFLDLLTDDVCY